MSAEPDERFMGVATNVVDTNTYFDYMNQAADGHFLFTNSYTPEEMRPLLIRPLYWFMGLFTSFLPSIFVYHLFRSVSIIAFIIIGYAFISYWITKKIRRRFAITALAVGSGFGWLFIIVNKVFGKGIYTTDIINPESVPFLSMNSPPHFIVSYILMMGIMLLFFKGFDRDDTKLLVWAGLLGLLMGFIHIYNMVTIYAVTGIFILIRLIKERGLSMKRFRQALIFYGISAPSAIYYFIVFTFDPTYHFWKDQNILQSPAIYKVIAGLGLLFFLGIVWIMLRARRGRFDEKEKFLLTWFVVNFIVLYIPIGFQVRFIEGYFLSITIVGTWGLFLLMEKMRINKSLTIAVLTIVVLVISLSNVYMFSEYLHPKYYAMSRYSVPATLSEGQYSALLWLGQNTDPHSVVLADPKLSSYIPRVSGNRVFVGHWAQTIDYDGKEVIARRYLTRPDSPIEGVEYVITPYQTSSVMGYEVVFQNEEVSIWRLTE